MRIDRMTIIGVLLLAGCATSAPKGPAQPAQVAQPGKAPQESALPFISRSAIMFPEKSKGFKLLAVKNDYPNAMYGVQLTYGSLIYPDSKIDIFVYPFGQAPAEQALDAEIADIRAGIDGAQVQGTYQDVTYGALKDVSFTVSDASTDSGLKMPDVVVPGRRLTVSMKKQGQPFASIAYAYYRYMYFIKLRITAPENGSVDPTVLGDNLSEEIVPYIHVMSSGSCNHSIEVHVADKMPEGQPGKADPVSADGYTVLAPPDFTQEQITKLLLVSLSRVTENGCIGDDKLDAQVQQQAQGRRVEWLKFSKQDWARP